MFGWIRNLIRTEPLDGGNLEAWFSSGLDFENVTEKTLLSVPSAYAGVRAISEVIAQLPLHLYQINPESGERKQVLGHPLCDLLCTGGGGPTSSQTASEFIEVMTGRAVISGNAVAYVERRSSGVVDRLLCIPSSGVELSIDERRGSMSYAIQFPDGGERLANLGPSEVIHLRGPTVDGYRGDALTKMVPGTIKGASLVETAAEGLLARGLRTSGFVRRPRTLNQEQATEMRKGLEEFSGAVNAGKVPFMPPDFDWVPMGMSNREAELLSARKFSVGNIARVLRTPPHIVGDLERATFSNISEQNRQFLDHTIMPWIVRWQNRLVKHLLRPSERRRGLVFRFDTRAFLRAQTKERYDALHKAVGGPFMTANEARRIEEMNPLEGLDEVKVPANMENPGGEPGETKGEA